MNQNKKNFYEFLKTPMQDCVKPEEKNESKKKKEKTNAESKKRSNRSKEERQKKNSLPQVPDTLETALSIRLNQFPMKPQGLIRKNQRNGTSHKRKKSNTGKTTEKNGEENPEKNVSTGKFEEITRPLVVKTSPCPFEKVLGLYRKKLDLTDDILHTVSINKTDAIKSNIPDISNYGNMLSQSNSNKEKFEKFSGHYLSKRTSPIMESYFNFKSSIWQKKISTEFQISEVDSSNATINRILRGHAQKVSAHSFKLGSSNDMMEYMNKKRTIKNETSNKNSPDQSTKNAQKLHENQPKKENKKYGDNEEKDQKEITQEKKTWKKEKNVDKNQEDKKAVEKERKDVKTSEKDIEKEYSENGENEKNDTGEKDIQKQNGAKGKEDSDKTDEESPRKDNSEEKRVTYTDRLLLNRFRKDTTDTYNSEAITASVIETLNSPFRDELRKKVDNCLNNSPKNNYEEITEQKPTVKIPSDATLKTTFHKQRSVREVTIEEKVNKTVDQLSKIKLAKSSELREIVSQAIKEHKIFCIFDNHSYIVRPVREELLNRGWLEVIPDRRLIPRRRPPPAGPTADRISTSDYAVEAILTAKETFIDDYVDVMSKFPPAKITPDKSKPQRKLSEESLRESNSEFRIVPPTSEKKKTNQEIREFVGKCQHLLMRKQNVRQEKEKKGKIAVRKGTQSGKINLEEHIIMSSCPSFLMSKDEEENGHLMPRITGLEKNEKDKQKEESFSQNGQSGETIKGSRISLGQRQTMSEADAKIASKIIQSSNARIHFMWLSIKPAIHLKCFTYSPEIVNKFQKTTFCTKIGLWSHLNNIQWYAHEVTFPAKSPRMYNTGEAEDLQAFYQDFQMTACIGILKWLSETFFDRGIKGVLRKKGRVPIKAFEFAIRQCERYIRFRENEDLNLLDDPKVMQEEWNTFLQWFYIITNDHGKVQETSNAQLMVVYTRAVEVLRAMKRHWPEIDIDGRLNIWIMKPYCASCGRGIFMTNNVYYIGQHSKYIVQKYIERPLLIYNTKFDIRQWFMITKLVPLEVWMYKECYLRFCTQPFVLRNLHESVHLSNNSVQRKYLNQKDAELPDQNMWDSNTFQQYLKTIGQPNVWNEVIYPGMRDAIISLMLAAQDTFDNQRRSWFEVYGADFMISANVKDGPWLIEINESPAMDPSTKVTAKLCPQMLRDVIKVVVDKRANKNALTGQWELVYRQNYSPSYGTISIDVKGKRIAKAPQNKTGYNNNWAPPPPAFNLNRVARELSREKEDQKKYDILKSYKMVNDNPEASLNQKSSIWGNRVKGKLIKDTSSSYSNNLKRAGQISSKTSANGTSNNETLNT